MDILRYVCIDVDIFDVCNDGIKMEAMLTNVNGTLQYRLLEDREAAKLLGPGAK
jgi:hypothetical protein